MELEWIYGGNYPPITTAYVFSEGVVVLLRSNPLISNYVKVHNGNGTCFVIVQLFWQAWNLDLFISAMLKGCFIWFHLDVPHISIHIRHTHVHPSCCLGKRRFMIKIGWFWNLGLCLVKGRWQNYKHNLNVMKFLCGKLFINTHY